MACYLLKTCFVDWSIEHQWWIDILTNKGLGASSLVCHDVGWSMNVNSISRICTAMCFTSNVLPIHIIIIMIIKSILSDFRRSLRFVQTKTSVGTLLSFIEIQNSYVFLVVCFLSYDKKIDQNKQNTPTALENSRNTWVFAFVQPRSCI